MPALAGDEAFLVKIAGNLAVGVLAGRIKLEALAHRFRLFQHDHSHPIRADFIAKRQPSIVQPAPHAFVLALDRLRRQVLKIPLGKHRQHMEEHAPHRGRKIEELRHRSDGHIVIEQFVEILQGVLQAARQAIQLVKNQHLELPPVGRFNHRLKTGAPVVLAGVSRVFIKRHDVPTTPLGKLPAGALLRR